jgi:hypothetical protein
VQLSSLKMSLTLPTGHRRQTGSSGLLKRASAGVGSYAGMHPQTSPPAITCLSGGQCASSRRGSPTASNPSRSDSDTLPGLLGILHTHRHRRTGRAPSQVGSRP